MKEIRGVYLNKDDPFSRPPSILMSVAYHIYVDLKFLVKYQYIMLKEKLMTVHGTHGREEYVGILRKVRLIDVWKSLHKPPFLLIFLGKHHVQILTHIVGVCLHEKGLGDAWWNILPNKGGN